MIEIVASKRGSAPESGFIAIASSPLRDTLMRRAPGRANARGVRNPGLISKMSEARPSTMAENKIALKALGAEVPRGA